MGLTVIQRDGKVHENSNEDGIAVHRCDACTKYWAYCEWCETTVTPLDNVIKCEGNHWPMGHTINRAERHYNAVHATPLGTLGSSNA